MATLNLLNRKLNALFKAATPRQPDRHRKERQRAKLLAQQHGITIEREDGTLIVWPQRGFAGTDPWGGDHSCETWADVLVMVEHYAGVKLFEGESS